ncbi:DUF6165 family protein [Algiphilus sp.]|uniref:DUF6165 family protein n=1 Tax=Algiphilus sp. TaxID=1872431 RepID=UPI0032EE21A0
MQPISVSIRVSVGELLDKLSILELKCQRIADPILLEHVRREWAELARKRAEVLGPLGGDLQQAFDRLRAVNETLWDVEQAIRDKEAEGNFDDRFIELARRVYQTNDERARIKQSINEATRSALREVKSYATN